MSAGPLAEKFNLVSNDHGWTHKWDFSVFNWKFLFWASLVKKIKVVNWTWNLVPSETNFNKQNSVVMFTFYVLDWNYPFWASLVKKIKIANLSWNLVPRLIRVVVFIFFRFRLEMPFLDKLGPKNQNCQFKLKFETYT